ncbi:MAG: hypothetical protein JW719_11765, partial [Pirellulales bacterium]|nr:hypothetical protein [Pirellulales bacterium]
MEPLEQRQLLSVVPIAAGAGNNDIDVVLDVLAPVGQEISVVIDGTTHGPYAATDTLIIEGEAGNDTLTVAFPNGPGTPQVFLDLAFLGG